MKTYFFLAVLLISGLASCSKKSENTAAAASVDTTKAEAQPEQIKITSEQFKNLSPEIGHFSETSMDDEIKATGMVDVPPENLASVSIPVTGFVKTIYANNALPGRFVTKGTTLATVESLEYIQMQQDYFQAAAQAGFLEKELERQQTLSAEDVGVKKKLQQAESEFNSNQALLKSLEAKLKIIGINTTNLKKGDILSVINITSPISGYIKNTNINTGKSVSPNDVLFEIISKEHLHVELKVLEKDAYKIQKGQKVLIDDQRLGSNVSATVFLVGQAFENDTKAINIHVHLDNEQQEQKLIPGMFVNARILTGTRKARTLPESAVIRAADGNFILVLEKQNNKEVVFRKIPVKLGTIQGQNIEVELTENLDPQVSVVINKVHFLSGMSGTDEE
jgi:cobalt-zinc-cadmium efflux system membrane fusion protein